MSKRFLKLFALVAIFVFAAAGMASAAAIGITYTWKGGDGNWGDDGKWVGGKAPTWANDPAVNTSLVVFPESTGTVTIPPNTTYEVGAVRVDGGLGNAKLVIDSQSVLIVHGDVNTPAPAEMPLPGIAAVGDLLITGLGKVNFLTGPAAAQVAKDPDFGGVIPPAGTQGAPLYFPIEVAAGKKLEFNILVDSNVAASGVVKLGAGTVAFTGGVDNKFNAATKYFVVRDGELSITRVGHVKNAEEVTHPGGTKTDTMQVYFDTLDVIDRTPVLTAAWANSQAFRSGLNSGAVPAGDSRAKIYAKTNGVINIKEAGATLVIQEPQPWLVTQASAHSVIVDGVATKVITKKGAGTLSVASYWAWRENVDLKISEGKVAVDAEGAFGGGLYPSVKGAEPGNGYYPPYNSALTAGDIELLEVGTSKTDVEVVKEATLALNKNQIFGKVTGEGSISIAQNYFLYVSANCKFEGTISGIGGVKVTTYAVNAASLIAEDPRTSRVTFEPTGSNPYYGDTVMIGATMLKLANKDNIGGIGKVYLRAREVWDGQTPAKPAKPTVAGALMATHDMTLRNEFYIDAVDDKDNTYFKPSLTTSTPWAKFMPQAATIFVPVDESKLPVRVPFRLELGGNIRYVYNNNIFTQPDFGNYRALQKSDQGTLLISNEGYLGRQGYLNMFIDGGRLEITEARAFGEGDVWVSEGAAQFYPTLYVKNGLNLRNDMWFDANSAFVTDVIEANRGETGTAAVGLGTVTSSANLLNGQMNVMIDKFSVDSVAKGDIFNVFESRQMRNYQASNVKPTVDTTVWDKAPFDVVTTRWILSFKALNDVDVPVMADLNPAFAKAGEAYRGTINVTSKTGLKPASVEVVGASWLTAVVSDATSTAGQIVLTGTAPADFTGANITVTVSTMGNAMDTSGYIATTAYEIKLGDAPTPGEATLTGGAMTSSAESAEPGQEVTFTVGSWTYTDAMGVITSDVPVTYGTPTVTNGTVVTDTLNTDGKVVVKVNADAAQGSTVTVKTTASFSGLSKETQKSISVTVTMERDDNMATAVVTTPARPQAGDTVKITGKLDPKYDVNTLAFIADQAGITPTITKNADGTFEISFTMPDADLSYYYTATRVADGVLCRSNDYDVAVYVPTPGDDDDGSSGCDAGFAGLALLLAAPLFFRKRS